MPSAADFLARGAVRLGLHQGPAEAVPAGAGNADLPPVEALLDGLAEQGTEDGLALAATELVLMLGNERAEATVRA